MFVFQHADDDQNEPLWYTYQSAAFDTHTNLSWDGAETTGIVFHDDDDDDDDDMS